MKMKWREMDNKMICNKEETGEQTTSLAEAIVAMVIPMVIKMTDMYFDVLYLTCLLYTSPSPRD